MTSEASDTVEDLLEQLTLQEKTMMLSGSTAWTVPGCGRLGIAEWAVSDGPVGVRGRGMGRGLVVPGPSALAATWNRPLVREVGAALGQESLDRRIQLLLAPTVNIHRVPVGGRHFECYSEDPLLTAETAVAYIDGVQSKGVGACIKHFVANDQEHERMTISSDVDERTLREIYFPPFEAAVRRVGVRSVMGAYNDVNGVQACANAELLDGLLRTEWGFSGFVVSDWTAVKDTVATANAGLDLEMPGPGQWWGRGKLAAAVERGDVAQSVIDDKVRRILSFLDWCGELGQDLGDDEQFVDRPEAREVAHRAATESFVLLRNIDNALPLDPTGLSSLAVVGPGAQQTALLGGGSASLIPLHDTSVLDALTERIGDDVDLRHATGVSLRRMAPAIPADWLGEDGVTIELFEGLTCDGQPFEAESGREIFNVWFADLWPDGVDDMSVRWRASITPDRSGHFRLMGAGFFEVHFWIDGDLIGDNIENGFTAGLGMHAGVGWIDLEAGRTYELVMEHTPRDSGMKIITLSAGIELDEVSPEELVADAVSVAAAADAAVVVVGSSAEWETEGYDRPNLDLPNGQDDLVRRVVAANPNTVVVLNCGAPMALPWLDDVPAALLAWYPGQEGGEAVADVLLGSTEPGGRLPTTWPARLEDTPAFSTYPGHDGHERYEEGIFVGYRWYDREDIEPLLPFGHGLSYTTFEWAEPAVSGSAPESLTVELAVTNVGSRSGVEVVQCYVAPVDAAVGCAPQVLGGWAKVHLEAGESAVARVDVAASAFSRWDETEHQWVVDAGAWEIRLGASARDIRTSMTVGTQCIAGGTPWA